MIDREIVVVAHNLRSCHNIGSLLRTAEGLGISKMYFTGYTPYPFLLQDSRLPHIAMKLDRQIHKTALGAEKLLPWQHEEDIKKVIADLKTQGYLVAAIEQATDSTPLPEFAAPNKVALLLGREVEGVEPEVLELCDKILEIPMSGQKESFNVVQAAAMAMYHCRFISL